VWLSTRGVVDEDADGAVVDQARRDVGQAVTDLQQTPLADEAEIAETARLAVRRAFARVLGYKPMTIVHVTREAP
jgi:hypothetical protein